MLNKDILQHQPQVDGLQDKASQLDEPTTQAAVDDLLRRYGNLKTGTEVMATKLHVGIQCHTYTEVFYFALFPN